MASNAPDSEPTKAVDAVLVQSQPMPEGSVKVKGIDFDHYAGKSITVDELVRNMSNMGFQASSLGKAIEIVDKMVLILSKNLYLYLLMYDLINIGVEVVEGPCRPLQAPHHLSWIHFQSHLLWTSGNYTIPCSA